ncbi:MAG TPA: universal stress protein [Mucilaginibacter sp.]
MKNILMLTDFSEAADNAAEYAARLATALKANIILFHTINVPEAALVSSIIDEPREEDEHSVKEALMKLEILTKKLHIVLKEETDHETQLSFFAQTGSIKCCINKVAADHKIDLIVFGARQYNEFPGFLFGLNIMGVVDASPCPVLLVHQHTLYRPIKNIFYVTDVRYSDLKVVTLVTNFARLLRSDVSLLHVGTDGLPALLNEEAEAIFLDTIASGISYKHLTYYNTNSMDTQSAFRSIIEKHSMDILAIAHKKHHFFNYLFKKNLERDPAVFTQIPILIIPDN